MTRAKDPWSSMTHMIGAVIFSIGTGFLVFWGLLQQVDAILITAAAIFGFSLVALYSSSATYHYINSTPKVNLLLRKLDHSMIYVLIAGSYTPVLLCYYPPKEQLWMSIAIWAIAFCGIAVKLLWFNAPRWLYTGFYLFMGWFVLIDLKPIASMPVGALILLAGGGLSYTAGGLIYGLKKPNISPNFGFHELFHIFVLLGSVLHYCMVLLYIL